MVIPSEMINLKPVNGPEAGGWIKNLLGTGPGPYVREQVPQCFNQYLRIFHPALDPAGNQITWSEVADLVGQQFHPQVQWHCLIGSDDPASLTGALWSGTRPDLGELPFTKLDCLCRILDKHTSTPARCYFGLSTIHGGVEPLAEGKVELKLPKRDFVVFGGPLTAAGEIGVTEHDCGGRTKAVGGLCPEVAPLSHVESRGNEISIKYLKSDVGQVPNLIWPADHSWFMASEMDFDSTLVGGSDALIAELMQESSLETEVMLPDYSLAEDADKVNCPQ
jgi:hypothetical protein